MRPVKLDEKRRERLLEALRAGNYMETACAYAGVGKSTFYNYLSQARDARSKEGDLTEHEEWLVELLDAVEKARADAEVRNVHLIQHAAQGGTWQAAAWFLERSMPGKWARREKVEMSGPEGGPITLAGLAELMNVSRRDDSDE